MKGPAFAFLSGSIFAVGLMLSGMTLPAKVVGFLDVAGDWDPSLAFVMGGAVLAYAVLSRLVLRRPAPLLGTGFVLPTRKDFTPELIAGAVMFGAGWGLAGYCPGPNLVAAGTATATPLIVLGSTVVGALIYHHGIKRLLSRKDAISVDG